MGAPGSGKTDSLVTLAEAGLKLCVIGTEPRFVESLQDSAARRKVSLDNIHWMTVSPMRASFAAMIASAKLINQLSYESLTQIKSGIEKQQYNQFITLLTALSDFRCERTGKLFGPVDKWGPDMALALDSLSGINLMVKSLVVGSKPTAAQGEWGVAMDAEEGLINKLTCDTRCFFTLLAHVDREPNEITGGTTNQVGALGKKLAPRIPRFFSEVVLAHRVADKFYWSNMMAQFELKKRILPFGDQLAPSYVPLVQAWKARLAQRSA